jgi:hypothetical protein
MTILNKINFVKLLNQDNLDEAVKLISSSYPKEIYKLFPPELSRIDALWNDNLWFSKPAFFDDPFDTGYWISQQLQFKTILKSLKLEKTEFKDGDVLENICNNRQKILSDDIKSKYLISSLTEEINSPVLWSQYAGQHKGFAVQYDLNPKILIDLDYFIAPVNYVDKMMDLDNILKNTPNTLEYLLLLTKGIDWSYQNEWRAIKKDMLLCTKEGCLLQSPKISSIHIGYKSDGALKRTLERYAKERNIWLYEMTTLPNNLRLTSKPIFQPKQSSL